MDEHSCEASHALDAGCLDRRWVEAAVAAVEWKRAEDLAARVVEAERAAGAAWADADRERARAEDERRHVQRLEAQVEEHLLLLGVLAHRVNTALAVILGWSRTLDEHWDVVPESERRDAIRVVCRQATATSNQTRSLLAALNADANGRRAASVALDLADHVKSMTEKFRGCSGRPIHFATDGAVGVRTDPDAVEEILDQLLENAIKYSPEETSIDVEVTSQERVVARIVVRDQGVGIPAGVDPFAPFSRADGARSVANGSGLGLYIARRAAGRIGAEITFAPNSPRGSVMTVSIPSL